MRIAILTTDRRESMPDCTDPQPRIGIAPEALLQGFAQLPEVEIHVVSCLKQPLRSPERIADNIFYHGVVVPRIGWMRTLYQGCIRAVRKKLREIRPDIVHGQGTERDCAMSAVLSGFPNVLTIHGNMVAMAEFYRSRPGSFHWLAARLENFALRRADGVFCNSAYTEGRVVPRTRRVWRVPNAVREKFLEGLPATRPANRPILLNVGVISGYKQQLEILAVARRLWERGVRLEMRFAGSFDTATNYGADFKRQISAAEAAGYARYLGELEINELIAAFDSAAALVHFPREESFGLVVAEALARNLKFFGAATGGVPDITHGVEMAELFPAGNWAAFENSLARWIAADCPRPANAAAVMCERYHPRVVARRHLEIYREVPGHR